MAKILKGAEVTAAINADLINRVQTLKTKGHTPRLAIVRIGERADDIAYEKSAVKRCGAIGVEVDVLALGSDGTQEQLMSLISRINEDPNIHGCLLLRPLPKGFDEEAARNALSAKKDVDGITDDSLAGVFAGKEKGFPPCTAAACIEILDHFGIDISGKSVVVIGRSLVVGKPVSMMLLKRNATVTICHTKTREIEKLCRNAEILITAAGRAKMIGKEYFSESQIVIDVGINMDESGALCGDVEFDDAQQSVEAITPVPGGVGTVTTSVLVKHVVEAAERGVKQ